MLYRLKFNFLYKFIKPRSLSLNTNGTTTLQLSTTYNGANIVTTAGNTRGLTFNLASSTTVKSGADIATFTNGTGNLTLAQVQNYTS